MLPFYWRFITILVHGLFLLFLLLVLCPFERQPLQGKRMGQLLLQPVPSSAFFGFNTIDIFHPLHLLPSLGSHNTFLFGLLFSPPRIEPCLVLLIRPLSYHSFLPCLLQNQVLSYHFLTFRWHVVVASLSLTCVVLFERLVLSRGLETGYPFIIPFPVAGPHIVHSIHGCLLSFSILALMFHIFLFLRWRVHGPATSTARSTRQPRFSISGTDVSWLLAGPGFCDSTPD